MWHIASSSGPTSNYGPGVEIGPMLWVLRFHMKINKEIFLSQTVRARAFILGMYNHLVALYQNTPNYGSGVEIGTCLSVNLSVHIQLLKSLL